MVGTADAMSDAAATTAHTWANVATSPAATPKSIDDTNRTPAAASSRPAVSPDR
jgi:hypothetical protein